MPLQWELSCYWLLLEELQLMLEGMMYVVSCVRVCLSVWASEREFSSFFNQYLWNLHYIFLLKLEEDFRESAERTLNATATNNDTGYFNDWNEVQTDVC